ncbi:MAG TPA: hypothetical protein VJV78_37575 [Polyangiales bacterium]|nr:hypothetical protein [Polyangiales bacterium]
MRGDELPELPKINRMSAKEFGEVLRADAEERDAEDSPWDDVLQALSLLPPGESSLEASIEEAADSVAAFYDPETKEVTVITDAGAMPSDPRDRAYVLSHELTHALQDRAHDLKKRHEMAAGSTDRRMALGMLVEGEATATSTRVMLRLFNRTADEFDFDAFFDKMDDSLLGAVKKSSAPLFTVYQGLPYSIGGRYVAHVWEQRDRRGVEALFDEAPPTAADWLRGDLGDPGDTSSEPLDCGPPQAPPGFELYELDHFGATGVVAMLAAHATVDLTLASQLTNDAFALYVTEAAEPTASKPVLGVWRLRFETGRATDEFEQILMRASLKPRRSGTELTVRVSSPEAEAELQGTELDACPKLSDLKPTHGAPTMPEAAWKPHGRPR